jgi:hypothetical protein
MSQIIIKWKRTIDNYKNRTENIILF